MQRYRWTKLLIGILPMLLIWGRSSGQFSEGFPTQEEVVTSGGVPLPSLYAYNEYAATAGETAPKINNIMRLEVNELQLTTGNAFQYFPSAFTATASILVNLWTVPHMDSTNPDISSQAVTLTVSYDPVAGHKYTPIAYTLLSSSTNGGVAYGKVTYSVQSITITGLTGSWTAANAKSVLQIQEEMDVLRYYPLASSASLLTPSFGTPGHYADYDSVWWTFPAGANNNLSQLEYAWVENETQGYYNVGGVFSASALFAQNSTRVDIDDSTGNFKYKIPLLYDANPATGGGTLYYRVRAVQRKDNGSFIPGPWSTPQTYAFNGHEPNLNWQVTTDFAENGKSKTVIQYYDGTLRPRQTVTKDNSTGNTTVAETIYDLQGRPNVQILPTPTMGTVIDYYRNFNQFAGQTAYDNPTRYFDLALPGTQCQSSPALDTTKNALSYNQMGGNGVYYSANNPWIGLERSANFVPDAKGYAYTETRYTDDPTQRVSVQGGAGQAYQVGNGHTTNYFYGKPAQNELDALFGTEVGDATHYFKNMVQDANGQMSISYVDMHGRTVATALAGAAPTALNSINNNTAFYPVSSGSLTDSLLTQSGNLVFGDSVQSTTTILVPTATVDTFTYRLTPAILSQVNCSQQQICFDCKYNLEISVRQEGCSNAAPIVMDYNNLQLVPANQACDSAMGFIGSGITTPTKQIQFTLPLAAGSWVVRKTLTINDSVLQAREDSALSAFLCKTQQTLADSVLTAMKSATNCSIPAATRNCTACQAALGVYTTFKANYLASLGGSITVSDSAIHGLYTQDSLDCADACAVNGITLIPAMTSLGQLRAQMLNDMTPPSGQYALPADSVNTDSLQAKYNIFTTAYIGTYGTFGTKPFYQHPLAEPHGATSYYMNGGDTADNTIYPGGVPTNLTVLNTITDSSFTAIFNRDWAEQLISYHPEYSRLRYAEDTVSRFFTWLDSVNQCTNYDTALSRGYTSPLIKDPYFSYNGNIGYVATDRDSMAVYLTSKTHSAGSSGYSIWQLANGLALVDSTLPLAIRESMTAQLSKTTIDGSAQTTAQQNAVWQAFRSLYLGYRNNMVMNYINFHEAGSLSALAMADLQTEGKQLHFISDSGAAVQNNATWWNAATALNPGSGDSVYMTELMTAYEAKFTVDQCTAEETFWQGRLMECSVLQQYLLNADHSDTVKVNTIINAIVDSMVMVCHLSINGNNPAGATNVNPVYLPVVPANFEKIVNDVFHQYGIDTTSSRGYFCNPYTIDYPKPFNANPPLLVIYKASADTCNCEQFAGLKAAAKAAGYDSTNQTSMNSYLRVTYNDTLSTPLWAGLQHCNGRSWQDTVNYYEGERQLIPDGGGRYDTVLVDSQVYVYAPISLGALSEIPAFLSCGYVKPCVSCSLIQALTDSFRVLYPAYAGVPYTSGSASVDTGKAEQNALWSRYLNYKTGLTETADVYAAAFVNCGFDSGAVNLIITSRTAQPPSGAMAPLVYMASNSISFDSGFTTLTGDNFQTEITGYLAGASNAVCALNPPVTYYAPPDTTVDGCQAVEDQANFIAQRLFQQLQDSLISNFDSLYRAKCLTVANSEVFYMKYRPSEYHYTLYYYDQAGNLLKTLPPDGVQPNYSPAFFASVAAARAANMDLSNGTNIESLATQYRYNTLNQVTAQQTPDGGLSHFWYDRLGRLTVSQNALQVGIAAYSYTLYDPLGRITDVGQKPQTTAMTQIISQDTVALPAWLNNLTTGGAKVQITRTAYDVPNTIFTGMTNPGPPIYGLNLRNRVAYTMVIDVDNTNTPPYRAATFYSYDPHGNVDSLLQDYGNSGVMFAANNRFKLTTYNYDLISGKVNQVSYQPRKADAFYHQYNYDAENRIIYMATSTDSLHWEYDANYTYYRHGPLARVGVGNDGVQGIDYAYTVQGWLKSINPSWITPPGTTDQYDSDGTTGLGFYERDAYKLNLNYFDDGTYTDFMPVHPLAGYVQGNGLPTASKRNLYNGNIGSMAIDIRQLAASSSHRDAGPMLYNYGYDQLNRISSMDAWAASGSFQPVSSSALTEYAERYTYDPNGNILTLNRNGDSTAVSMDQLSYKYIYANTSGGNSEYVPGQIPTSGVARLTNQLSSIQDAVTGNSYTGDIKTQPAFNYRYDAIGELIADSTAKISNVVWNVYGKILSLSDSGNTISFTYDAAGNRISKLSHGITTWYVRDAQGNVMSVYTQGNSAINGGSLTQAEVDLYGSSRLGLLDLSVNCATGLTQPTLLSLVRGNKLFELTNHLGNVLETVSDKKNQHTSDSATVDYYMADVINANDYYSFGMEMPVRSYNASTAANYRYGFNGKEQDPEVKGAGEQYDYGMRMYDPRVGRFLSRDPVANKYPDLTPYQYASSTPIAAVDIDGLEPGPPPSAMYAANKPLFDDILAGRNTPRVQNQTKIAIGIGVVAVVAADYYFTGGQVTGTVFSVGLTSMIVGSVQHNTAPTAEGRAQQSQTAKEDLTEAFITWGSGEILGQVGKGVSTFVIKVPYTVEASQVIEDVSVSTSKVATNAAAVDYEALYQKYKASRPYLSQKTINDVWSEAKDVDGNVYDPNTGEKLSWDKFKSRYDQWHMGHKTGHEYRTLLEDLRKGKITEAQFKKAYNTASNYQPESPSANMSHKFEQKIKPNGQVQTQSQNGGN